MEKKVENQDVLRDFEIEKVLSTDRDRMKTVVLLKKKSEKAEKAILIMQRNSFKPEIWLHPETNNSIEQYFENDIFRKFHIKCGVDSENLSDIEIIFPADEFVIEKYTGIDFVNIVETPDMYNRLKKNYIDLIDPKANQWIDNLFQESSSEKKIFINEEFVIGFPFFKLIILLNKKIK